MSIGKFSASNPVLVNMLMIVIFGLGAFSLLTLPTELNPPIKFNWVFITVVYPGASPSETESLITDPIESEISDVDNIDEITSTSGDGFANILVKFEDISDSDFRERYVDLKAELDKVDLPSEAEDPTVDDFSSEDFQPVINVNMAYTIPEHNAQTIAEEIEEDLEDINGIKKIQISGLSEREIWVEINPEKMYSYNISFNEVINAISQKNLNVPGGNISFGKYEYTIRALGEYESIEDIANTIVRAENGLFVRIKDIGIVEDTREEKTILSRISGKNSITFSVSKKSDANSIDLIDKVKELITSYEGKVQDGVTFSYSMDNSVYIMRVIDILKNNAIAGMILIAVILYFFLGGYNSLLAALGIPISFFITFIFLDMYGYSFNGSTLFALVMVLGIIVDDAIIILENCHRYRLMGYSSYDAAIKGTNEVVGPIISSILTNIAAFLPLILIGGIMGKFMRIIPIVFSLALIASLFEAFILLPAHYADWTKKSKVYKHGEKKFFTVLREKYTRVLTKVIKYRYAVLVAMVFIWFFSVIISVAFLEKNLFGEEEFDQFSVLVTMPEGTSLEETDRVMKKFEAEAELLPKEAVSDIILNVGLLQGNNQWSVKKSVAQMLIQLKPVEERTLQTDEVLNMLRGKTSNISGPISVEFEKLTGGPPTDKPISVKVQGKYFKDIKLAAEMLRDSIRTIPGTFNVNHNFPPGKQEIKIEVDETRSAMYGFSSQEVAMAVRTAFDGVEATEYRDGDEEVDVMVKLAREYRSSIDNVLSLKVTNNTGTTVALRDLVDIVIEPGKTDIKRIDQERTITVTGEIDKEMISMDKVNQKLMKYFPAIEKQVKGTKLSVGGQFEEFANLFKDVGLLGILSIGLIFLILGTQFKSYLQPLIILVTVPFAVIGALMGLIITGNDLGVVAIFGIVALAGIVVNDAIVMIDFMNTYRKENSSSGRHSKLKSVVDAGRKRLRPIILTSMTTILGLVPMAIGVGGMSEVWSPLANVIVFGLAFATLLTLFMIPALITILDDIKGIFSGKSKV